MSELLTEERVSLGIFLIVSSLVAHFVRWIAISGYEVEKESKPSPIWPHPLVVLGIILISLTYFLAVPFYVFVKYVLSTLLTLNGQTGIFNNIIQCVSVLMAHFNSWFGV